MRRISTLMSLFLAMAVSAYAQEPWTLDQCIDYALSNNISVKQQEITVGRSEIDLNSAKNSRLPGMSGNASENFSFGRGLTADNTYSNTNTTSTSFNLGVDVPVFQGFQIRHDIALNKLNLAAAVADLDAIKDNISISVARAYVQILYDKEIAAVARNQVSIDSLQFVRLVQMKANGKASGAEVAQQKAALGQSRHSLTQALNNLDLAVLELSQLLELQSPEGFDVITPDEDLLQPKLLDRPEEVYAQALATKAVIQAEQTRLDAASTQISLAKSRSLPTLSLSGGIGTNYYTSSGFASASFFKQMKNNFSQSIGLSLSIPIFNRLSIRNSVRTAKLSYNNQQLQLESAKKSLYKEIQQAYTNAVGSQSRFLSSEDALESALESFELVKAKYENGKANVTEYEASKATMVKAQSDLAQARYENYFNTKILEFYEGLPL